MIQGCVQHHAIVAGVGLKAALREQHALRTVRVNVEAFHAGGVTHHMGLADNRRAQARLAHVVTHGRYLHRQRYKIPG